MVLSSYWFKICLVPNSPNIVKIGWIIVQLLIFPLMVRFWDGLDWNYYPGLTVCSIITQYQPTGSHLHSTELILWWNILISSDIKYLERTLTHNTYFIDHALSPNSAKKWDNLEFHVLFGLFLLRSQKWMHGPL